MSKRRVACAAVTVGIALSGCGGGSSSSSSSSSSASASSSSNTSSITIGTAATTSTSTSTGAADFTSGFAASKATFKKLGADLGSEVQHAGTKTDAQIATEFAALATRARQQAAGLAQLTPSPRYRAPIAALISGFTAVAADLTAISKAGVSHSVKTAETATRKLLADAAKVKAADTSVSKGLGLPTH